MIADHPPTHPPTHPLLQAGFYLDATEAKWATHYRMYTYITQELPALLKEHFSDRLDLSNVSITGRSMDDEQGHPPTHPPTHSNRAFNGRTRCPHARNEKPHSLQIRVGLRPHRPPHRLSLGHQGLHWLPR